MARPRQTTDAAILAATRACVLRHGASVSTTVIADAVGVSQATLFKRFGTKEELLVAALAPAPDMSVPWLDGLEAEPPAGDLEPRFRAIILGMVSFFEQLVPRMAALKAAGLMHAMVDSMRAMGQDAPPIRGRKALARWLDTAQRRGQIGPGDPQSIAIALMSACMGLASRRHMLGDTELTLSPEGYAAELSDLLWRGLAPDGQPDGESP